MKEKVKEREGEVEIGGERGRENVPHPPIVTTSTLGYEEGWKGLVRWVLSGRGLKVHTVFSSIASLK